MITVMNLSLLEVELNPTGICSDIVHRTVMSLHPPPPPTVLWLVNFLTFHLGLLPELRLTHNVHMYLSLAQIIVTAT